MGIDVLLTQRLVLRLSVSEILTGQGHAHHPTGTIHMTRRLQTGKRCCRPCLVIEPVFPVRRITVGTSEGPDLVTVAVIQVTRHVGSYKRKQRTYVHPVT